MTEHLASTQPAIQRDNGGDRQVMGDGSSMVWEAGSSELTSIGVGTVAGDEIVAEEHRGTIHQTVLTITDLDVTMTDATTSGNEGSEPLLTFPRGLIQLLGAVCDLAITAAAGIGATAAAIGAVGSVAAAADATLTGTEADFIPSTTATLTASAGTMKGRGVTGKFFDNTTTTNATQLAAHLNFAVPDAGSTGNSTITVNGTVTLTWINHGDN